MKEDAAAIDEIEAAMRGAGSRTERLRRVAGVIRRIGGYRWAGIYDVSVSEITVAAWDGPGEPAHPRFPISRGLCGEAVRLGRAVVVPDVTRDERYLTTLGSTRSEIVVPILDPATGRPVGTLDVESGEAGAFGEEDRAFLERCAAELARRGFSG
jgi:putative methionine-R-sulfoxide reductase with GAF domain